MEHSHSVYVRFVRAGHANYLARCKKALETITDFRPSILNMIVSYLLIEGVDIDRVNRVVLKPLLAQRPSKQLFSSSNDIISNYTNMAASRRV